MKFTVQRNELLNALNITGRCIGKSVMPILDYFKFEINEKTLQVTASSMKVFISKQIEIESDLKDVAICIPAKKLHDFIKTLANQSLVFTVKQNKDNNGQTIEMKHSSGELKMILADANDFPELPNIESEPIEIPNQDLINGFSKTTFAVYGDDSKVFCNLLMDFGNGLNIVGADGFRVCRSKVFNNTVNLAQLLLPITAPDILTSLNEQGNVKISYSINNVLFENESGTKVYSILSEGAYPNVDGLLGEETDKAVKVNTSELLQALKRVVLFSDRFASKIKIRLSEAGLTLRAENEDGERGEENVSCEYLGEEFEIGVIFDQFNSVISKVKSDNVYLSFISANKPVKIKEHDSNNNDNACIVASCTFD